MHSYHDTYKTLPPQARHGPDGRPLLSWRVLILPFVEGGDLYKKFKLDEPWDSPHNLKLLPQMPRTYAPFDGSRAPGPGMTFYQVFVGPGTAFEGSKGLRLRDDFPNGLGKVILIAEAAEAVPWTKPQDLVYRADRPLPGLGGLWKGRDDFRVVMADAGTRSVSRKAREAMLRAVIARDSKEPIPDDWGQAPR
jgi:hypothetical protein